MIDRAEIARMLGVSVEVLRKRVEAMPGYPAPALRLSRKTVRWERPDIERFLAVQRQRATSTARRSAPALSGSTP
jgi:hypothetical protein